MVQKTLNGGIKRDESKKVPKTSKTPNRYASVWKHLIYVQKHSKQYWRLTERNLKPFAQKTRNGIQTQGAFGFKWERFINQN